MLRADYSITTELQNRLHVEILLKSLWYTWMLKLKADQLKGICRLLGAPSSGTKPVLASSITAQHQALNKTKAGATLVSVDLGLKNIGICVLKLTPGSKPVVTGWSLFNLGNPSYAYPAFAETAAKFTDTLMAPSNDKEIPSLILIERQRSRSSSSAAVPHDILRINVLEGMLHTALLCAYPHVQVASIDPKSVLTYWKDVMGLPKTQTYRESKKLRLNLVSEWLGNPDKAPFSIDPNVVVRSKGKKDDLDDALTQAITWTMWQKHSKDLNLDLYE